MLKDQYTSIEQAWNDLQSVPSYVERNLEEDTYTLVVTVDITDIFVDAAHVAAEAVTRG